MIVGRTTVVVGVAARTAVVVIGKAIRRPAIRPMTITRTETRSPRVFDTITKHEHADHAWSLLDE